MFKYFKPTHFPVGKKERKEKRLIIQQLLRDVQVLEAFFRFKLKARV
jgi:hypothetical protein